MEPTMLFVLIPVAAIILFPAAFIWYCAIGGICHAVRNKKAAKIAAE